MKKIKEHVFVVVVKSRMTRKQSFTAVLSAFARREPDGCLFHLRNAPEKQVISDAERKDAWEAGEQVGFANGVAKVIREARKALNDPTP